MNVADSENEQLLLFTLGPVQRFIAAARKTSDLWSGSALLSWLAKQAIQPILVDHEREAFIFPYVEDAFEKHSVNVSYPNRFVARVPAHKADTYAKEAKKAAQEALLDLVEYSLDEFEVDGFANEMALRQACSFLECYWSILPLNEKTSDEEPSYEETYRLLEQQLGARKALRNFDVLSEPGYRCDLIPSLAALVPGENARPGEVRRFWRQKAERSPFRYLQENEELSAIALSKRLFPDFQQEYSARGEVEAFSSTSSFATADFKAAVLKSCQTDDHLRQAVINYENAMRSLPNRLGILENPIPRLADHAHEANVSLFHRMSGRWMFQESLDQMTEEEVSEAALQKVQMALRALLKAARAADIPPPSRYYALLLLDGDKMGAWLSGARKPDGLSFDTHYHKLVSRALGHFAQHRVPAIVERCHLGRLVYSGGDDVMALCSLGDALSMARELRAAFSDHRDASGEIDWTRESAFSTDLESDAPTLGSDASASAGVVIAHHMQNLQQVLDQAREAEAFAKNRLGRDALALAVMKRSGERSTAGGHWTLKDANHQRFDLVAILEEYMNHVQREAISRGFVHTVASEAPALQFPEAEKTGAVRLEVERIFNRQSTSDAVSFLASLQALLSAHSLQNTIHLLASAQFLSGGGRS